jgi:Fe-S cluster assembly ATPase SufC
VHGVGHDVVEEPLVVGDDQEAAVLGAQRDYQRLLNHIVPDTVHVMAQGRVVKSGGKELALEPRGRWRRRGA